MKIPENFKNSIKETFYDKEVALYTKEKNIDDEGFVTESVLSQEAIIKCDIRFDNLAQIQEEHGLDESIDIVIISDERIPLDSSVKYDEVMYTIVKSIPYDAYNLMFGRK